MQECYEAVSHVVIHPIKRWLTRINKSKKKTRAKKKKKSLIHARNVSCHLTSLQLRRVIAIIVEFRERIEVFWQCKIAKSFGKKPFLPLVNSNENHIRLSCGQGYIYSAVQPAAVTEFTKHLDHLYYRQTVGA